jgi:hypothetical protein
MQILEILRRLGNEFQEIWGLYCKIAKEPNLLILALYQVAKDWFYELPKSLFTKGNSNDPLEKINKAASLALGVSEIITIPGTFVGVGLFNVLGANDYIASTIGGPIGNYLSGAVSYLCFYLLLTAKQQGYSLNNSLKDGFKVIRDVFPAVLVLYVTEAPFISGLLAVGLSRNIAVGLNVFLGIIIFTGVAKISASEKLQRKDIKTDPLHRSSDQPTSRQR